MVHAERTPTEPRQVRSSPQGHSEPAKSSSLSDDGEGRWHRSAVADDIKVLGVVLDRRLTFGKHVSAVARSCNYHAHAIHHICHLLTTDLAQTLACSLILSRIDYCNAVLHPAPSRRCNMCKTTPKRSFIKRQDDHMRTRC